MDAGACAAGRSSYATGNEATRRIHGGRCPVGRRSREGVGFCESEDSYEGRHLKCVAFNQPLNNWNVSI